jgi:GMP synthase-like glutamine amidotransferase
MSQWLAARGAELSYTRFFESAALPDPADFDLVIAMGGPMSANDEAALPWLRDEKRFVAQAVERGVAVLGICLGAQLIASAMGARVYPNGQKEIGWFDIEAIAETSDLFAFPQRQRVFHWHGETFELPPGALQLARSAACANQAFQLGRRTIGLQFHLETTPDSAALIAMHCRDELADAPYVQSEALMLAEPRQTYVEMNALMERLLDYLTGA